MNTKRFHSKFVVYGARKFSPRTRFVYSNNINNVKRGIKKIKPDFYVIRKEKLNKNNQILSRKKFLDENFQFVKNFKNHLLYKIPPNLY